MDPTQRIADYLAAYRITDQNGIPVDTGLLASDIGSRLGKRKRVYASCFRRLSGSYVCQSEAAEVEPSAFLAAQPPDCVVLGEGVHAHRGCPTGRARGRSWRWTCASPRPWRPSSSSREVLRGELFRRGEASRGSRAVPPNRPRAEGALPSSHPVTTKVAEGRSKPSAGWGDGREPT